MKNQELDALLSDEGQAIEEARKRAKAEKKASKQKGKLAFPVDAFPPRLQEFIKGYCSVYGSAPEHYGLALFTSAAAVIGNSCWATERDAHHPPVLYSVIVDFPAPAKRLSSKLPSPLSGRLKRNIGKNTRRRPAW